MKNVLATKDDLLEIWKSGGWREEFYKQVNSKEPFGRAFLRSANSIKESDLNNKLLRISKAYYPGVVTHVKSFQKRVSGILIQDPDGNVETILLTLGETRSKVSSVLSKIRDSNKKVSMSGLRPKNEQLTSKLIFDAWNNGWSDKFEEFVDNGMSFGEAFIKSAKDLVGEGTSIIKETSERFSSVTLGGRTNFIVLVSKTLHLYTSNMRDVLMHLYAGDENKVNQIIGKIQKRNTKKKCYNL